MADDITRKTHNKQTTTILKLRTKHTKHKLKLPINQEVSNE